MEGKVDDKSKWARKSLPFKSTLQKKLPGFTVKNYISLNTVVKSRDK